LQAFFFVGAASDCYDVTMKASVAFLVPFLFDIPPGSLHSPFNEDRQQATEREKMAGADWQKRKIFLS